MLDFNTAEEELFYLFEQRPSFHNELLALVDSGRIVSHKFVYGQTCGCVYWAFFGCPNEEYDVVNGLDEMFESDLDQSMDNSFGEMTLGTMRWISPLQYRVGTMSQAAMNVWLRARIADWREMHR